VKQFSRVRIADDRAMFLAEPLRDTTNRSKGKHNISKVIRLENRAFLISTSFGPALAHMSEIEQQVNWSQYSHSL
jgi:hypothetical protein